MACCGQRRASLSRTRARSGRREPSDGAGESTGYSVAFFHYSGTRPLTVRAPVTGSLYRFERPGAVVAVDPRDMRSLARVPHLRQVLRP